MYKDTETTEAHSHKLGQNKVFSIYCLYYNSGLFINVENHEEEVIKSYHFIDNVFACLCVCVCSVSKI